MRIKTKAILLALFILLAMCTPKLINYSMSNVSDKVFSFVNENLDWDSHCNIILTILCLIYILELQLKHD